MILLGFEYNAKNYLNSRALLFFIAWLRGTGTYRLMSVWGSIVSCPPSALKAEKLQLNLHFYSRT